MWRKQGRGKWGLGGVNSEISMRLLVIKIMGVIDWGLGKGWEWF